MIYFDSDYMEGAHPKVMQRLLDTNMEHSVGYGFDPYCDAARDAIRRICGTPEALVFFLPGGTQTNSTVIDALLLRQDGVMAAPSGHINVHESGAIEHSGHKILTLPSHDGKVSAQDVETFVTDFYSDETSVHMVAPGMLYITQPTEFGTLYSLSELTELSKVCHSHNIPIYLDGARLGYALVAPEADFTLEDIARLCDVFYIGGTKCGLLYGEAVVAPNPAMLPNFFPLAKQHGAVMAKGRLLGLQFDTLFKEDENGELLYESICRKAISLAARVRDAFTAAGCKIAIKSPTNQQFIIIPNDLAERLREAGVSFELWGPKGEKESTARFVTSWATTDEDVDRLAAILAEAKR